MIEVGPHGHGHCTGGVAVFRLTGKIRMLMAGCCCALAFGACSRTAVPVASRPISGGDGGASAEVVFNSPMLAHADFDSSWRDGTISRREELTPYERAAWPTRTRPDIGRPRRIYLDNRPETYLFFREEGRRYEHRGYHGRW